MERDIFKFKVGDREFSRDPLKLQYLYDKECGKVDIEYIRKRYVGPDWLEVDESTGRPRYEELVRSEILDEQSVRAALGERDDAHFELVPIICKTFGFKHIDEDQENGLVTSEIFDIFNSWREFAFGVKKNTETSAG